MTTNDTAKRFNIIKQGKSTVLSACLDGVWPIEVKYLPIAVPISVAISVAVLIAVSIPIAITIVNAVKFIDSSCVLNFWCCGGRPQQETVRHPRLLCKGVRGFPKRANNITTSLTRSETYQATTSRAAVNKTRKANAVQFHSRKK
jgi:hypothetical protein